jgi:hypothetical protein
MKMKKELVNGGKLAQISGKKLEDEVKDFLIMSGVDFIPQKRFKSEISKYTKVDFYIKKHSKLGNIIVECRNGDVPGSHMQKMMYLVLNSMTQQCDHYVILVNGNYAENCTQTKWCKDFANNPQKELIKLGLKSMVKDKKWHILNLSEFKNWLSPNIISPIEKPLKNNKIVNKHIKCDFECMGITYNNKRFLHNYIEFLKNLSNYGVTVDDIKGCIPDCHMKKTNTFSKSHYKHKKDFVEKININFYVSTYIGIEVMLIYLERIEKKLGLKINKLNLGYK